MPLFLFSWIQHGTPPVEATDQANNQPHIVVFTDDDAVDDPMNQYFIAVEQTPLMQCSNASSAIFLLAIQATTTSRPQVEHSSWYPYGWIGSPIQIFHHRGDGH